MVCGHVFRNERQIKVVVRHTDGGWQLVCGEHDHPRDCADFQMVGLNHLTDRQNNLGEIGQLKRGLLAEWTPTGWQVTAHDD